MHSESICVSNTGGNTIPKLHGSHMQLLFTVRSQYSCLIQRVVSSQSERVSIAVGCIDFTIGSLPSTECQSMNEAPVYSLISMHFQFMVVKFVIKCLTLVDRDLRAKLMKAIHEFHKFFGWDAHPCSFLRRCSGEKTQTINLQVILAESCKVQLQIFPAEIQCSIFYCRDRIKNQYLTGQILLISKLFQLNTVN